MDGQNLIASKLTAGCSTEMGDLAVIEVPDIGLRAPRGGRPKGSTGPQIERVKRQLASLVVLGKRNSELATTFGVTPRTIRTWLAHPDVQHEIAELEQELYRSNKRLLDDLFRLSIKRMGWIIRSGDSKQSLRAIEMLWIALGRLPPKGGRQVIVVHGAR